MTEDEFLDARDVMQTALKRAVEIVQYISGNDETAQLDILENGDAALTSWGASTEYDCAVLEKETQTFPARLLFVGDDELAAWRAEEKRKQEAETKHYAAQARAREAQERAEFQRLKAKFEKTP